MGLTGEITVEDFFIKTACSFKEVSHNMTTKLKHGQRNLQKQAYAGTVLLSGGYSAKKPARRR